MICSQTYLYYIDPNFNSLEIITPKYVVYIDLRPEMLYFLKTRLTVLSSVARDETHSTIQYIDVCKETSKYIDITHLFQVLEIWCGIRPYYNVKKTPK